MVNYRPNRPWAKAAFQQARQRTPRPACHVENRRLLCIYGVTPGGIANGNPYRLVGLAQRWNLAAQHLKPPKTCWIPSRVRGESLAASAVQWAADRIMRKIDADSGR